MTVIGIWSIAAIASTTTDACTRAVLALVLEAGTTEELLLGTIDPAATALELELAFPVPTFAGASVANGSSSAASVSSSGNVNGN